jgi:hypothetical protein
MGAAQLVVLHLELELVYAELVQDRPQLARRPVCDLRVFFARTRLRALSEGGELERASFTHVGPRTVWFARTRSITVRASTTSVMSTNVITTPSTTFSSVR